MIERCRFRLMLLALVAFRRDGPPFVSETNWVPRSGAAADRLPTQTRLTADALSGTQKRLSDAR